MSRLWVDDVRPAPEGWDWAKTSAEALAMLAETFYDEVSLDHDLGWVDNPLEDVAVLQDPKFGTLPRAWKEPYGGGYIDTTRPIVLHWCEHGGWPHAVYVHSANPVGREWLEGMIDRYWTQT